MIPDSRFSIPDSRCGVLVLEAGRLRYGNSYARLLLRLPVGAEKLPDAEWSPLLTEDRAAARQETGGTGRYRTVTFASGKTARWWVMPWAGRDFVFLLNITAQQQAEQTGRTFLNDLSHELRTPIATILTHLEILGLADVGEELRQQSLTFSKEEARRMARLVDDMLELGRLESLPDLPRRPLELLPLVEAIVLQDTPRAAAQQMSLALEAESPLPLVAGNADRLRQVFLNLLDNAFKYARSGDRITISLRRIPEGIACAVCDTGPGITPEQLPYVTRRFYRAPGTTAPGSGLGLALVAEILRRHKSRLELESQTVGETGTCARFVLLCLTINRQAKKAKPAEAGCCRTLQHRKSRRYPRPMGLRAMESPITNTRRCVREEAVGEAQILGRAGPRSGAGCLLAGADLWAGCHRAGRGRRAPLAAFPA